MRNTTLFIAMSLDGYIADSMGGVDWLQGQSSEEETSDSYSRFVEGIDTILMGWNTYRQIVTELSPEAWVYEDFTTYVFTHKGHASTEKIRFTHSNPVHLTEALKKEPGKGIWICGGANLVQQFVNADAIDRYHITVIPALLGSGVRLFKGGTREIPLRLLQVQSYNGMTDLIYTRR